MKINTITIGATISTAQYNNIAPSIEIQIDDPAEVEQAKDTAMSYIRDLSNKYGDKPLVDSDQKRASTARKLVKDIFGNEIYYDDANHIYSNSLGEVYLSGSAFCEQFEKPFNADLISGKMASKAGLSDAEAQVIRDMWRLKAEASMSFGTSIHAALELYGKYKGIAEKVGKETHLHDNVVLNKAVTAFYDEYPNVEGIAYEALVVDHKKKRAGRIDRLEYDEDGVWVTDFKTNFDVKKSIKKYWLQLSFYSAILKANGLNVKGLKIYHYNGETWKTIPGDVIDIDK